MRLNLSNQIGSDAFMPRYGVVLFYEAVYVMESCNSSVHGCTQCLTTGKYVMR